MKSEDESMRVATHLRVNGQVFVQAILHRFWGRARDAICIAEKL